MDPADADTPWHLIVGIGVNVNTSPEDLPPELREIAGSIAEAAGGKLDIDRFALSLIEEFDLLYQAWEAEDPVVLSDYRKYCTTIGKDIFVIDTVQAMTSPEGSARRSAFVCGINDDFSLKVRYEDGSTGKVNSGEVSVRVRPGGGTENEYE